MGFADRSRTGRTRFGFALVDSLVPSFPARTVPASPQLCVCVRLRRPRPRRFASRSQQQRHRTRRCSPLLRVVRARGVRVLPGLVVPVALIPHPVIWPSRRCASRFQTPQPPRSRACAFPVPSLGPSQLLWRAARFPRTKLSPGKKQRLDGRSSTASPGRTKRTLIRGRVYLVAGSQSSQS